MPITMIDHMHTALLVIDVQCELFEKSTHIYKADELLANVCLLVSRAHQASVPVFYIQHSDGSVLVEGTHGWQLHSAFQPQEVDTILQKHHGNAFEETSLDSILKSKKINRLAVVGLVTHGCVKATCLGALELGYEVTLVRDGHSSYSKDAPQLIDKWNQKLEAMGCMLMPATEITFG